jgi:hypothetical protein
MKNIEKTKPTRAGRDYIVGNEMFKIGYQDGYYGNPWADYYDKLSFNQQLQYEQGRLFAIALKSRGVAPRWKLEVQCPRDLPRLMREHGRGVVPLRYKVSA